MLYADPAEPTPIPAQLERSFRDARAHALLAPGDSLPSVRQLAVQLRVNANAVEAAYRNLLSAGLVTQRADGDFVVAPTGGSARPGTPSEREHEMRRLEDDFLAEAARLGYSLDDVIIHLDARRR